ncbi:MAG: hypothetical protein WEB57_14730 [Pseudohongiellaceae bacterium]
MTITSWHHTLFVPMVATTKKSSRRRSGQRPRRRSESTRDSNRRSALRTLRLPFILTLLLFLLIFTPRVQDSQPLLLSLFGACAVLLAFQALLYWQFRSRAADAPSAQSGPVLEVMLRPQHYVQASVQASVFAYWGYYWQPVYEHIPLLIGQLLFAYVFDMLLHWSRRAKYVLGFGPFPIIFSINLFLWFRDEWFYMQFVMIAAGFLGKEFIRWHREGRSTHIFNPSAFTLGLFSLVLILTGTTDLTQGQNIASTLTLAPNIYTFLFLVGLIVMYLFSITLVAGMAALALFGLSALYSASTGVPYFVDAEIPAAVFLGLHLLISDPSTSPRTPVGKALFGTAYGLGVFALYRILGDVGAPTFYDKLLVVPLLNLLVPSIDRLVRGIHARTPLDIANQRQVSSRANVILMGIWAMVFIAMSATGKTDGRHAGDSLPFWQQACAEDRPGACATLIRLETTYCDDNAGWACNELGVHLREGTITETEPDVAQGYFSRACELRFQAGCVNLLDDNASARANPRPLDLQLLLREGGRNLSDMPEAALYARACDHGWSFACTGEQP